jgi:signal peptidase I
MRTVTERLLATLVALLVVRTFVLDGFPIPCQVVGSSMAETLLGPHYEVTCPDCGYRFACEAAPGSTGYQTACPSCGCPVNGREAPAELAGDRVLIDKMTLALRPPRRWEVVAFMHPASGGDLVVKRVVGLPGETIEIRQGAIYIDGRIQRKSLWQQRAVRILVHDAAYRPTIEPAPPPRWQGPAEPGSGWHWTSVGVCHRGSSTGKIDWLVYRHWQRAAKPGEIIRAPVMDLCSYNQGRPRREEDVHPVTALMLSVHVAEIHGAGQLWLRATDGLEEFRVAINPGRQNYAIFQKGRDAPVAQGDLPAPCSGATLEASLFDQQFLLAVGGRTLAAIAYDRPAGDPPFSLAPLAIGCQDLEATLEALRVYRDIYYCQPSIPKAAGKLQRGIRLGDSEFFVLGDNSPISEDSRTWRDGRSVTARELVGFPFLVVFPARGASLGGKFFQVPDLGQIRYIR